MIWVLWLFVKVKYHWSVCALLQDWQTVQTLALALSVSETLFLSYILYILSNIYCISINSIFAPILQRIYSKQKNGQKYCKAVNNSKNKSSINRFSIWETQKSKSRPFRPCLQSQPFFRLLYRSEKINHFISDKTKVWFTRIVRKVEIKNFITKASAVQWIERWHAFISQW